MPVYDLPGRKVREAVPMYAHADGREPKQVAEDVRKYMEQGYRHVRAQMGGYGGGGMIPPGQGSRPTSGFKGAAFDEDVYLEEIPKLFEYLRTSLGKEVKLLHDVHEHLTPTGAVELAKRTEPSRMLFVKDLLPTEKIDWFPRIKHVCTTPTAMREQLTSPPESLPLLSERAL